LFDWCFFKCIIRVLDILIKDKLMQIIILDTETTGIDEQARLVQLAYKNITTGEIVDEYFKPPVPISYGAMAISHITEAMVVDKPVFDGSSFQVNLKTILENNILVAHNAPFDIKILKNEGVKTGKNIDTVRLARHLFDSEQYKLQYLRYFLKLNVEGKAHDAMGDILVLEALFDYLKKAVKEKFSLVSDNDIFQKMIELTQTPVLLKVFTFGKYIGKSFEEVNSTDQGYLKWLFGSESSKDELSQNEELIYTLKKYLAL
jgi:exodeoxyribonuclease X